MAEPLNNVEAKMIKPVSFREYILMDRHAQKAFNAQMSFQEQKVFSKALAKKLIETPRKELAQLYSEKATKLKNRENKTIPDRFEATHAKLVAMRLQLPEKP